MIYKTDTVMNCTSKIFWQNHYLLISDCNLHRVRRYQFTGCDTSQSQLNKFMLQIKELQQHPDAVAFWQEHITIHYEQLSGRHCIGFRCGTSVTSLRWTGFFRFVACSLKGAATECLSHWKCECGWSWMWSWLVDWAGRHSNCCILTSST